MGLKARTNRRHRRNTNRRNGPPKPVVIWEGTRRSKPTERIRLVCEPHLFEDRAHMLVVQRAHVDECRFGSVAEGTAWIEIHTGDLESDLCEVLMLALDEMPAWAYRTGDCTHIHEGGAVCGKDAFFGNDTCWSHGAVVPT